MLSVSDSVQAEFFHWVLKAETDNGVKFTTEEIRWMRAAYYAGGIMMQDRIIQEHADAVERLRQQTRGQEGW